LRIRKVFGISSEFKKANLRKVPYIKLIISK
jgi:hypothetical protein